MTIFFLALFHSVMIFNQDQKPPEYNIHSAVLCTGDALTFGDRTIKFKKVVSDSRCPNGATCIWAGEVKVLVEFYEGGKYIGEKIVNGSNTSITDFFDIEELNIRKFVVTPYPEVNYKISQEEYAMELSISETVKN